MDPYTIHNDFDEFDFPENSDLGDLLEKVTTSTFGNNLVFAIIETTTISNVAGVGTTHIIAYKDRQYIEKTIHPQYLAVIDEIADNPPIGSPSKYFNWYQRSKYYYAVGSNKSDSTFENSTRTPNTMPLEKNDKKSAEKYILDYPRKLTDTELKKFFKKYVDSLLTNEWFREAPYFFVLVKPISVKNDGGSYIALGNLYLKVGTKTNIDIEEYKKYVSLIQAAWFKKFGAKILEEYSTKKISDEYKPKIDGTATLKNKLSKELFKSERKSITLNDFFSSAFDSDKYTELKDKYLIHSEHEFVKDIVEAASDKTKSLETIKEAVKETIKNWYDRKDDPLNILNKTVTGLKSLDDDSIRYFLLLLSKRRLALALLLVFGFSLEDAHSALAFGQREFKDKNKTKAHTDYFGNNLFITQSNLSNEIIKHLADRERLFLEKIVWKIQIANPSFKCKLSVNSSQS